MRLWSLHPHHLDTAGLTACWREGLLAQAVLAGRTKGYRSHPQLQRFRATTDPIGAMAAYLDAVAAEATARGFRFDASRIDDVARTAGPIAVTQGQLEFELAHLRAKLAARAPDRLEALPSTGPEPHPLFTIVPGPVEDWERV